MPGKIRIATLRGPSAVGMVKMMDDARKCGGFETVIFDEPALLLGEMSLGKVDFAVLPTAVADSLHARGIEYSTVAVMIRGGLFVCGRDRAIRSISDLKGRTISVMAKGSAPENMLRNLICKAGLNPDTDVEFDYSFVTHKALSDAAENGLTELCVLSEPFVSQVVGRNGDMHILLNVASEWQKAEGSLPSVASFLCKDSVLRDSPELLLEVKSRLRQSCDWVRSHPHEAAELVCEMGVFSDVTAVERSIPNSGFDIFE